MNDSERAEWKKKMDLAKQKAKLEQLSNPKVLELTPRQRQLYESLSGDRFQKLIGDALSGELSGKDIIKAKCVSCVNFEDTQNAIAECNCQICPLWKYRPYQPTNNVT